MKVEPIEQTESIKFKVALPTAKAVPFDLEMAVEQAALKTIDDANALSRMIGILDDGIRHIKAEFEEPVRLANEAHKSLTALRGKYLDPWVSLHSEAKRKLGRWNDEQERLRIEEQRRLEAAARKEREEKEKLLREQAEVEAKRLEEEGHLMTVLHNALPGHLRIVHVV